MDFFVELSFDTCKRVYSDTKNLLLHIAYKYNSTRHYIDYEPEGTNRTVKKNKLVMTCIFDEEDLYSIVLFLREIKRIPKVFIESIYDDKGTLIFASKKYLRFMSKESIQQYKKQKKEYSIYDESMSILIKEIYHS